MTDPIQALRPHTALNNHRVLKEDVKRIRGKELGDGRIENEKERKRKIGRQEKDLKKDMITG